MIRFHGTPVLTKGQVGYVATVDSSNWLQYKQEPEIWGTPPIKMQRTIDLRVFNNPFQVEVFWHRNFLIGYLSEYLVGGIWGVYMSNSLTM